MRNRTNRAQLRLIWSLVAAVAAVQLVTWLALGTGRWRVALVVSLIIGWVVTLALAFIASRQIGTLATRLMAREDAHRATLDEVEQLQTQNAMLEIVARSIDVPLAFQALAVRIARLVSCDRVGLALLNEAGDEFETYTVRVDDRERRERPRRDVVFRIEGTLLGKVTRSAEPILLPDVRASAAEYLDANVLSTAGFRSALLVPLVSNGRGVGTLNVVARARHAFGPAHVEALRPIAEILAVAHIAQQLNGLMARHQTIETMAEATLAVASEINSALQTIAGYCGVLERTHPDSELRADLAIVTAQAHRIAELLEKMRTTTQERLKQVAHTIRQTPVPPAPDSSGNPEMELQTDRSRS